MIKSRYIMSLNADVKSRYIGSFLARSIIEDWQVHGHCTPCEIHEHSTIEDL